MQKILRKKGFISTNTPFIAKKLLGKFLVRNFRGQKKSYMITEVEAYHGPYDQASHAHRGKTERNTPMFDEGGSWYVYFTYGIHWMLNITTGPKDYPAAVLVRGVYGINGPARLTKRLYINKKLNGKVASRKSGLWIEDRGVSIVPRLIKHAPRIGVAYAGKWALKPYRFYINSPTLSRKSNVKNPPGAMPRR